MPRHSKNNCSGSVFTHWERREAAVHSGWGTQQVRLGKDALRAPDVCCLTLQPAQTPVVTPEGFLFDKAALLEYYLAQKEILKRKLAQWKQQQAAKERHLQNDVALKQQREQDSFEKTEFSVLNVKRSSSSSGSSSSSSSSALDSNFWLPQNTPEVVPVSKKPDMDVMCPMSGKPLKITKLIECKFSPSENAKNSSSSSGSRYMCPLSNKEITHSMECVVLKPSGRVISQDSLITGVLNDAGQKIWKKYVEILTHPNADVKKLSNEDKQLVIGTDPFSNHELKLLDIVLLRSEGTGNSGDAPVVVTTALAPAFVAS